ncbi:MAG: histone-like nucleoid-structuring protein Lsr2 [Acidothermaceae bacterium]
MAQKTQVTLIDDIDGSTADETLRFSLGRDTYEIDLSKSNAKRLRDALSSYVSAGRRVGGRGRPAIRAAVGRPRGRGRAASGGGASASPADIRAWAKSRGIKVNERGRISADIVAKYEAAH